MKKVQKSDKESWALGVFVTLELLKHKPNLVKQVFVHSKSGTNSGVEKITEMCGNLGIIWEENDRLLEKMSGKGNCFAGARFEKFSDTLDNKTDHVVLVNIADAGNLGTILRTCLGMGIKDVAIIEPAVDRFDPKVVRAAMGAIFTVRVATFRDFSEYQLQYPRHYYPFMTQANVLLPSVDFETPFSLIFGSEAAGLGVEYKQLGTAVKIPQSEEIDSYNLAMSVALGIYQARFLGRK